MSFTSQPLIALVLPGDALWGARQTGFSFELGRRLTELGFGEQPFSHTIGSSSGSLIATAVAAGGPFDHDFGRSVWTEFGKATRFRGHPLNPYPQALADVFKRGLINPQKAFSSRTHWVVTAAQYEKSNLETFLGSTAAFLACGLERLLCGEKSVPTEVMKQYGKLIQTAGSEIFTPRYFTNKATTESLSISWTQVGNPEELEKAVKASSRIPFLYGPPILEGTKYLIDGVFVDNAPVKLALQMGAQHVFVVTSSSKGLIFKKPIQSMFQRQFFKKCAPAPLDLNALQTDYPDQEVHIIRPQKKIRVNRLFESDSGVLGDLYDMGVEEARSIQLSEIVNKLTSESPLRSPRIPEYV